MLKPYNIPLNVNTKKLGSQPCNDLDVVVGEEDKMKMKTCLRLMWMVIVKIFMIIIMMI